MKSLVGILLSLLVFSQSVGIGISHILMIDKQVAHIQYHSENHADDYFTFLKKHYASLKAEHQKNNKEEQFIHDKLPFKHNSYYHLESELILITYIFPIEKLGNSSKTISNFRYENLYSLLEKPSVFQPPKFA